MNCGVPFACFIRAREEIELWKERQAQVSKEEARLKESMVSFKKTEQATKKVLSRQSTRVTLVRYTDLLKQNFNFPQNFAGWEPGRQQ
jgi:hypothetical protein